MERGANGAAYLWSWSEISAGADLSSGLVAIPSNEQETVECDDSRSSMRKSQHPLRDAMHLSRVPNYHRALPKKLKALVFFDRPDGMEELLTSMRIAG